MEPSTFTIHLCRKASVPPVEPRIFPHRCYIPRHQISSQILRLRGRFTWHNRSRNSMGVRPPHILPAESILPVPSTMAYPGLVYEPPHDNITCSRGTNSQKLALALARQRATYHGRVSSDESRAIQESHLSVPPFQYWFGEHPPYRRSSPFRHISVLTSYRAQVEAFSEFCDALQLEKHAILLVLPAQRIELLHFSRSIFHSGPYRSLDCPQSFQWISRIWKLIMFR